MGQGVFYCPSFASSLAPDNYDSASARLSCPRSRARELRVHA